MNHHNRNSISKKELKKPKENKFPRNKFGYHYDNDFAKKIKRVGHIEKVFEFDQFAIRYNDDILILSYDWQGEPSWIPSFDEIRPYWLCDKDGYCLQIKKKSKKFHKQFIKWWKRNRLTK